MSLKITGMDEVFKKLKKIDRDFNRKVVKPAINAGLEPIKQRAKQNCRHESLRKLISKKAFISKRDKQTKGKVYLKPEKERKIKLDGKEAGFEVVGNIMEFGSQKRNIRPQPFMIPAGQSAKGAAAKIIETKIREKVSKL